MIVVALVIVALGIAASIESRGEWREEVDELEGEPSGSKEEAAA